ncbi:hypothetical protein [Hymenobacter terrenus]|uniref:hypothetical protein n=1 Tax=Hymenobacter terrenus TaxID=1629124 RepID=UPI0012E085CE|nr:hypothetical protein [Hymenobacter terrenus]
MAEEELVYSDEVTGWNEVLEVVMDFLKRSLNTSQVEASFLGNNIPVYTGFIDGDLHRIK